MHRTVSKIESSFQFFERNFQFRTSLGGPLARWRGLREEVFLVDPQQVENSHRFLEGLASIMLSKIPLQAGWFESKFTEKHEQDEK